MITPNEDKKILQIDTCNDLLQDIEFSPAISESNTEKLAELRKDLLELIEMLHHKNISSRIELSYRIYTNACKAETNGVPSLDHLIWFKEEFGYELGVQAVVELQKSIDASNDVQETA